MRGNLLPKFGLSVLLALIPAFAGQPLSMEVPFDFHVGTTRMSAGEYHVRYITPEAISIRSADRKHAQIVLTFGKWAQKASTTGKLVFTRYGDQYFLSQIWSPGQSTGRELRKSAVELEVARRINRGGDEVALRTTR